MFLFPFSTSQITVTVMFTTQEQHSFLFKLCLKFVKVVGFCFVALWVELKLRTTFTPNLSACLSDCECLIAVWPASQPLLSVWARVKSLLQFWNWFLLPATASTSVLPTLTLVFLTPNLVLVSVLSFVVVGKLLTVWGSTMLAVRVLVCLSVLTHASCLRANPASNWCVLCTDPVAHSSFLHTHLVFAATKPFLAWLLLVLA